MTRLSYLLSFIILTLTACQEVPPVITPPPPTDRTVLIEEFTGVGCIRCPDGSIYIKELLAEHEEQLIAISIHAGEFSNPYPQNLYDFRTDEGNALQDYLGQPFGFPTAVINRRKFDGQFSLQVFRDEWAGYINEEKARPPMVNIDIESNFDNGSRNATIGVTLDIDESITYPDVRLTVAFTEDNIVDHQLTPTSSPDTDPDYVHNHVLRGTATPYDGIPITEDLTIGSQLTKSFTYSIPTEWKENDVNVIAFVSLNGEQKEVLQAYKVHLIE